jgi:hypothetical protein
VRYSHLTREISIPGVKRVPEPPKPVAQPYATLGPAGCPLGKPNRTFQGCRITGPGPTPGLGAVHHERPGADRGCHRPVPRGPHRTARSAHGSLSSRAEPDWIPQRPVTRRRAWCLSVGIRGVRDQAPRSEPAHRTRPPDRAVARPARSRTRLPRRAGVETRRAATCSAVLGCGTRTTPTQLSYPRIQRQLTVSECASHRSCDSPPVRRTCRGPKFNRSVMPGRNGTAGLLSGGPGTKSPNRCMHAGERGSPDRGPAEGDGKLHRGA